MPVFVKGHRRGKSFVKAFVRAARAGNNQSLRGNKSPAVQFNKANAAERVILTKYYNGVRLLPTPNRVKRSSLYSNNAFKNTRFAKRHLSALMISGKPYNR